MPGLADLRHLPSVDRMMNLPSIAPLIERHGRVVVTDELRGVLVDIREAVKAGAEVPDEAGVLASLISRLGYLEKSNLRPLFNLTGTVLHTNLGRALLAEEAIAAAIDAMRDAAALEFDLDTGRRGERDSHLRELLCELTGAEDATIVNNNAAAVLISLNAIGAGRQAIVSRGELIEIGGAFRMPDIMERAGVELVEVGTTNRTHARDYIKAVGPETALILKVHTSNYRIEGFTAEVEGAELARIARDLGLALLNDLGSGTLVDLSRYGLAKEPTVREAIVEGADLVTFSGDKLLGGPQAGFIVGRKHLIAEINRNPLKRALRVDKIRIAALAATLKLYRDPDRLGERLPTLRMLSRKQPEIRAQAERLLPQVTSLLQRQGYGVEICPCSSQIGSGALPVDTVPSAGLRITAASGSALEALASLFRSLPRPILGRLQDGAMVLDLRCLTDENSFIASLSEGTGHALA
ncbi:L-seryl-tRNA(Sec) selenium transferase [Aliirhizobium cellulosilyticum]|uniref:L-seryl-tRNA(Sec) selenium transferase n=1 Tax=Aliirhizobium cellulosilyticum TaxID=393664 RepID=A0A7W6V157_9HYPH|nr:L-seryl-tRNA(Sec) selenium transferase [Rhizobium cellulosilyticum]MBB4349864.1 L-seryl-tRNA(Ser) seleniumtransferase [Rhizobium cellulosilyticum]MBB4413043.1 L-seryl-tRNA(Ser) seleniumtransferase [Rhizobium cellulosilyticum]MBB4448020.1 L-seryl-tRNA(Ser) seleniumtransferase [Rhizobium cellulosilyticum]